MFKCLDCEYKSNRFYNLTLHIKRKHKREVKEEEKNKTADATNRTADATNRTADATNRTADATNRTADATNRTANTIEKEKKNSEKIFPCEKCGKTFKRMYNLKKHMVNCLGISNILECHHCHKILSSSGSKSRHMKVCRVKIANELVLKMEQNNTVNSNNTNMMNSNNTVHYHFYGSKEKRENEDSDDELYDQIERNNFGDEKIEYISEEELTEIAKNLDVKALINRIYFDEEHPENQNIRKNCKKSLKVLKDQKWIVETKESIYNRMLNLTRGTIYNFAFDKLLYKMYSEIQTNEFLEKFTNNDNDATKKRMFEYIDIKLNECFKKIRKTLRLEFEKRLQISNGINITE
jgi:hypothetical protein